ncbi:hypothetical protein BSKO_01831 [Bryopsis sp. KO-2023]|nr:hypothetical protein BSKO_01831 [Bryopsis sp. KO-2023]
MSAAGFRIVQTGRLTAPVLRRLPAVFTSTSYQSAESNSRSSRFFTQARRSSALADLQEEKEQEGANVVSKLEFDTPLRIVEYPDPRLRADNSTIKVPAEGLEELSKEMFRLMYEDDGVGLAAPQVGMNIRMMVFNPEGFTDKSQEVVLVNPKIIKSSKATDFLEEGCLSFRSVSGNRPLLLGDVERPVSIKVKARDLEGKKVDMKLEGFVARVFQHEYDHLQQTLFFERMSPEVLAKVKPELVALEEKFMKENPGVEIQRVE